MFAFWRKSESDELDSGFIGKLFHGGSGKIFNIRVQLDGVLMVALLTYHKRSAIVAGNADMFRRLIDGTVE